MRSRFAVSLILPLLLSVPASGLLLTPLPEEPLVRAAERVKVRDYTGARDWALKAREGGIRDFLAGYGAYRSGAFDEALPFLERAAATYPLLGDYARFFQADALSRTGRSDEALAALRRLFREYPGGILTRRAALLEAEILFTRKEWGAARNAYLAFSEKYTEGADAVSALSRAAECRENLADQDGAAALYRSIWLNHPASPLAKTADERLRHLTAAGTRVAPFSREELFKRASTLFDLRRHGEVLAALDGIPSGGGDDRLSSRIDLKRGQTLYRLRRYQDAAGTLNRLAAAGSTELRDDALLWYARSLDKNGRDEEAVRTYLLLAETFPKSALADDALLEAALIRKSQGDKAQSLALMERMLFSYPQTDLRQRARWEIGWTRYLMGQPAASAEWFRVLAESPEIREKALYWLGRSHEAAGNREQAATVFATLSREYPAGFYTTRYLRVGEPPPERIVSSPDFIQTSPVPPGYDRIKALITLGMVDEARTELAVERKKLGKQKGALALARLYLELGDYKIPMGIAQQAPPTAITAENLRLWNLSYPLPYREPVAEQAGKSGVPETLVYAVMRAESSFSPTVLSPAGAVGLMQLMPATAREVAGKGAAFDPADLTRPEFNIACGVRHLKDLLKLHDNNPVLAVAAYNAGSGSVNKWRKRFGTLREDEFIENIPYAETREYVKKVLAGADLYGRLYNLPAPFGRKPAAPASPAALLPEARFATISTARTASRL